MRKRRDWIVVGVVAALLAAAVVLVGTIAPGATGKAVALGTTPSPWPSPSAGVVLQVGHEGTFVKEYTLADLEALGAGPFNGFAGYMNSGSVVYGPEAVSGIRVTDIVNDALASALLPPLTTSQSVAFIGSDGYAQTYSGDQLMNVDHLTQMYGATTKKPVSTSSFTGPFAAVLCYDDPGGHVMSPYEALRLFVEDATNEPIVMTGSDSVKWVARLNVTDTAPKDWSLKLTGLKINGVRQTRTIRRNDYSSCISCHDYSHKGSYTTLGYKWRGVPLYMLVGEVDGGATMVFNAARAQKGYRIEVISSTGATRIVSSRVMVRDGIGRRNALLAWTRDGVTLGSTAFPLRLIAPGLKTSLEIGRITKVVLLPPVKR